jgi:hypothetical protein
MMFGAGLARLFPDLEGTAATAVGCRLVTASKQLFAKRLFHGRSFEQQPKCRRCEGALNRQYAHYKTSKCETER